MWLHLNLPKLLVQFMSSALDLQLFVWHKHAQFGSDHTANLFHISHIDSINHTDLLVPLVLLFPLMWRLVLITEVSRGLTQFANPRVSLSASLLRAPLCRAELDPPPRWKWGGGWWERGREMGKREGSKGRDGSQHWGPMQGCRRWRAEGRGRGVTGC